MRASDIERLQSVSRPTIAPDRSRAVVALSRPDLDADTNVGQLWSVPLDGHPARRITRGTQDSAPTFSPDGRAIAFLRSIGDSVQLFAMPADGGEPVPLTDQKLGVTEFDWSPDSRRIAYVSRVPEQGRYGTVTGIAPTAEPARRVARLNYKFNGIGYTVDRPSQVFVVEVPELDAEPPYTPAPRPDGSTPETRSVPASARLTDDEFNYSNPRYTGDRVAALAARHADRDRDLRNQVWLVGGAPEPLTPVEGDLSIGSFEFAPDGTLHLLAQDVGADGNDFVGRNTALYRVRGGAPERLHDPSDTDLTGSDLAFDGERALVTVRARGRGHLTAVSEDGDLLALTDGDVQVQSVSASGGAVVLTLADAGTFGDVAVLENGVVRRLTDFSARLRGTDLVEPVELEVLSRDGYPVHGWVARPAGEGPHPALLMIHGGPFADFGVHVFDETQVYADAGYAVVYCNPRGSAGYGEAHGRAIRQRMGTVDYTDVLDFLDGALRHFDDLDDGRVGILGGSYGGYLTAWTIGNDHRFKAAVVERGYLDPTAFVGSSDIGMMFPQQYNGTEPELIAAQSPQAVAQRVTTPTLVIHSELDLRCPLAQAETYYATLRLAGVDAEMLIFPGENHELSRSGRPRHRIERFEAILDWFGRHL